jgi:hypothetical protein
LKRSIHVAGLAMVVLLVCAWVAPAAAEGDARQAALTFGKAMQTARAAALKTILPGTGRIHLRLFRLGPEEGQFSPSQVEALLNTFLRQGVVHACKLLRIEQDREGFALAHFGMEITDTRGQQWRIELRICLQAEGQRWVLREIWETRK